MPSISSNCRTGRRSDGTLFALASAALYAMALGLTIISGEDGWLVRFLQLSDKVVGGKAALVVPLHDDA